ncbi:hypothetical protein [Micromonospora sp. RTGN7]|uniref:hypothetical protein n=1 Tax=Micromonospora sp. RTGN7 TaxID=3016526 RepID=UPI0029FF3F03|nr:hypothetical protein [Micromonospora sp. RTGN7]
MVTRANLVETDPIRQLYQRLADLEAEMRELRAARRLESAAIGAGGLTVRDGGTVAVDDTSSNRMLWLGQVPFGDGTTKPGMVAFRATTNDPNRTVAMSLFDGVFALWDRRGTIVVSTDEVSGSGLARPYIPVQVGDWNAPTNTTTSATFTDMALGYNVIQHPVLHVHLLVRASDATTAGQARVTIDGTPAGPTTTITAGAYSDMLIGPFAVTPTAGLRMVAVQARRTAGTGTIGVRVLSIVGLESAYL